MNNIKTLSIVVPNKECVNSCPFCVSKLHTNNYDDKFELEKFKIEGCIPDKSTYYKDAYIKRLQYARDIGIETVVFTGLSEPLQNLSFINEVVKDFNSSVYPTGFPWLELQTTGYNVEKYINELAALGISTISLSVSNLFSDIQNSRIIGSKEIFVLRELCRIIKNHGLNLRITLMMLRNKSKIYLDEYYDRLIELGVDQVTFKYLYMNDENSNINNWIARNRLTYKEVHDLQDIIETKGDFMYNLPFGMSVYDYRGISTLIDDDCMSKHYDNIRYLILREDCKLYSSWDSKASLIF